jgi:hypothetical protein
VAKETGDDDFCDVGSVGAPGAAHTHHSEEVKFGFRGRKKEERFELFFQ